MLVAEIGYLNSISKSRYGIEVAKPQNNKANLNGGFGQVNQYSGKAENTNTISELTESLQDVFAKQKNKNNNNSKKYLSLIG